MHLQKCLTFGVHIKIFATPFSYFYTTINGLPLDLITALAVDCITRWRGLNQCKALD